MSINSGEFSMNDAKRMASSQAGQALFAHLRAKNGEALDDAMAQARAGNMEGVKAAMSALMADPQVQQLLRQLGGNDHG